VRCWSYFAYVVGGYAIRRATVELTGRHRARRVRAKVAKAASISLPHQCYCLTHFDHKNGHNSGGLSPARELRIDERRLMGCRAGKQDR
jgi:hypothetical protein